MAMRRNYRRRNVTKKNTSRFFGIFSSLSSPVKWIAGLVAGGLYIYFFYSFVVSPFTQRWRGIYGDPLYPDGYSIRGIDVSHHQGEIDWDELRHAEIGSEPVSFIFIKATEGKSIIDENFKSNFSQAKENGLIRGAYHYYHPEVTAKEQIEHFINNVKLRGGDLPPVLDVEEKGNLTTEELQNGVKTWLTEAESHYKVKPILYTNYKFKKTYLDTQEFREYPYWIAHYYVDTLAYTGAWKFWQHTDRGRIDGINGYVDIDVYNGSMYDLRQLTLPDGDND